MKQYRAVVIGLGKIGQGFDYEQSDDSVITTHASAYVLHPGYELLAAVDPDLLQRKRFEKKFQLPAYPDLQSLMGQHNPEIFSIAVPAEQHFPVFLDILRYMPVAVLCEKPIAASTADGRRMRSLAEDQKCALVVNYMRRFEPGSIEIRRMIQNEELGDIFKGHGWYSKGLINNGSHFIDLLRFWLGEVTRVEIMKEGRQWDGLDPEPDICLYFHDIPVYFLAGREECFSVGEINLFCGGGMIRYANFGNLIEVYKTYRSPFLKGYTVLSPDKETVCTDLKRYQLHVLEGLYKHLTVGDKLNSDGGSATETLEVIEHVCSQLKRVHDE
ncbi:MAG: Gfo/Idh/MocA family oxidoreductase [Deltaproteobacteria bacterium]